MYDFQRFLAARDPRDAAKVGAAWSLFLIVRWGMAMGIAMLALTGAIGVSDPEQVMPTILRDVVPVGMRGFVIAGLLAAFMSTFSSTVNSGAAFVVRDLWQLFLHSSRLRSRCHSHELHQHPVPGGGWFVDRLLRASPLHRSGTG